MTTKNETPAQKKARVRREAVAQGWECNGNGWTPSTLNTALKNGEIELPPHPDFDDGITQSKLEDLGYECSQYDGGEFDYIFLPNDTQLSIDSFHNMKVSILTHDKEGDTVFVDTVVKTMYALKQLITALGGKFEDTNK